MPLTNIFLLIALILIAAACAQMLNSYRKAEQSARRQMAILRGQQVRQPVRRVFTQQRQHDRTSRVAQRHALDSAGFISVGSESGVSKGAVQYDLPYAETKNTNAQPCDSEMTQAS